MIELIAQLALEEQVAAIRAECLVCRHLPKVQERYGQFPCRSCVKKVARLFAVEWEQVQQQERRVIA